MQLIGLTPGRLKKKELKKLNNNKMNNPVTKWAKGMSRQFTNDEIKMAQMATKT